MKVKKQIRTMLCMLLAVVAMGSCGKEEIQNQKDSTQDKSFQESIREETIENPEEELEESISGEEKEESLGYEVKIVPYELMEECSFSIVQVEGMEDKELEEKVNETLKELLPALCNFGVWSETCQAQEPVIHLQGKNYLSVENPFEWYIGDKRVNILRFCITVNVQTGELVYMDDLIYINEEFAMLLKSREVIERDALEELDITAEEMTKLGNERYASPDADDIVKWFQYFTRKELYNQEDRHSFTLKYYYLEEGYLVYNLIDGEIDYKIRLDKITDVLKVEPW